MQKYCSSTGTLESTYLDLPLRKLKHMQRRMHISPRHTPTMMPVTAWMSSSVRTSEHMENKNISINENNNQGKTFA